jgi:hypothetical protein
MRIVAFDLETHVIQPGLTVPPVVVGSAAWVELIDGELVREGSALLHPATAAIDFLEDVLRDEAAILVGQNIAFDLCCAAQAAIDRDHARGSALMTLIFAALFADRVFDVRLAEKIHAIGAGHLGKSCHEPWKELPGDYSLDVLVEQVLGRIDAKEADEWQLRYHELALLPLEQWPPKARQYPVDDAVNTLLVALAQMGYLPRRARHVWGRIGCERCGGRDNAAPCMAREENLNLWDVWEQSRAAMARQLGGAHGLRRDPRAVYLLDLAYQLEHDGADAPFREAGILRPDGSEDQGALARKIAGAYDPMAGPCETCAMPQQMPPKRGKPQAPAAVPGKVRNAKNNAWINCPACRGTALDLSDPGIPRTPSGGVAGDRDVLFESGDDLLVEYAEYGEAGKIPTTMLPWLRAGLRRRLPATVGYNTVLATNRVSARGPILTFQRKPGAWRTARADMPARFGDWAPRPGERYYSPSPREAIVPQPGWVFSSSDYEAGEMVTWAEVCYRLLGHSKLGEAMKRGLKPHSLLGARVLGITYEEFERRRKAGDKFVEGVRQLCKIFNFGSAGGMKAIAMLLQARANRDVHTPCEMGPVWIPDGKGGVVRGYRGIRFCITLRQRRVCGVRKITQWRGRACPPVCEECAEIAQQIGVAWSEQWPESEPYFDLAGEDADEGVVRHTTGLLRAGHGFCATANGHFQELLARATKRADARIARECYDASQESVLYGARAPGFFHDELLGEHPAELAAEQAPRIGEIMEEELRDLCPHVAEAVSAKPALMLRWDKRADAVLGPDGKLVPWRPPGDDPWPSCILSA